MPYDEQWEILRAIVEGVPRFGGGVVDGGRSWSPATTACATTC